MRIQYLTVILLSLVITSCKTRQPAQYTSLSRCQYEPDTKTTSFTYLGDFGYTIDPVNGDILDLTRTAGTMFFPIHWIKSCLYLKAHVAYRHLTKATWTAMNLSGFSMSGIQNGIWKIHPDSKRKL